MFDFRYHALSLVAVFLALAIGILLGAAIGDSGSSPRRARDSAPRSTATSSMRARTPATPRHSSASGTRSSRGVPDGGSERAGGPADRARGHGSVPNSVESEVRQSVEVAGGAVDSVSSFDVPSQLSALEAAARGPGTTARRQRPRAREAVRAAHRTLARDAGPLTAQLHKAFPDALRGDFQGASAVAYYRTPASRRRERAGQDAPRGVRGGADRRAPVGRRHHGGRRGAEHRPLAGALVQGQADVERGQRRPPGRPGRARVHARRRRRGATESRTAPTPRCPSCRSAPAARWAAESSARGGRVHQCSPCRSWSRWAWRRAVVPAAVRGLLSQGFVRENYRGRSVAFPAGIAVIAAALVALVPLALIDQLDDGKVFRAGGRARWSPTSLGGRAAGADRRRRGERCAGDSGRTGRRAPRGWRGHARATLHGRFSTGTLKAAGSLGIALFVLRRARGRHRRVPARRRRCSCSPPTSSTCWTCARVARQRR